MFTDRQQRQTPTITVSKYNMWSNHDWVFRFCRPSVNTICGPIMVGFIVVVRQ
jgi:hypothetical protein